MATTALLNETRHGVRDKVGQAWQFANPQGYATHKSKNLREWAHFRRRGHEGKVNKVAAAAEVDYIVSGGEDYTMRIWGYDTRSDAYDLAAVLVHDCPAEVNDDEEIARSPMCCCWGGSELDLGKRKGVTAVACAGIMGPFISGTADGQVTLFCLSTGKVLPLRGLHEGAAVNDICTLESSSVSGETEMGDLDSMCDFLMATVSEAGEAHITRVRCEWQDEDWINANACQTLSQKFGQPGRLGSRSIDDENRAGSAPTKRLSDHSDDGGHGSTMYFRVKDDRKRILKSADEAIHLKPRVSDGEVTSVRPLTTKCFLDEKDSRKGGACFATATAGRIHLWSKDGEELCCIDNSMHGQEKWARDHRVHAFNWIATAIKDNGTLLLAASDAYNSVGVWSLDANGELKKEYVGEGNELYCPEPCVVYKRRWHNMDVDQSGLSTDFAVALQEDGFTVVKWNLLAVPPGMMALQPSGPEALLLKESKETIVESMTHSGKVKDLRVVEDPEEEGGAGGPALLVGLATGEVLLWDIEGEDSGQIYAAMRSLNVTEIVIPPLNVLVSSLQMLSFAFGPSIPWNQQVKRPAVLAHELVLLDFTFALPSWARQTVLTVFWWRSYLTIGVMSAFILSAVIGMPAILNTVEMMAQQEEFNLSQSFAAARSCFRPRLWLFRIILAFRAVWVLVIQLCATILVVPMVKAAVNTMDCTQTCGGEWVVEELANLDPPLDPPVKCWTGDHLRLMQGFALVLPLYLFFLLPHAVVGGDTVYAPSSMVFSPKMWVQAAHRKATAIHMGSLHPNPGNAFKTQIIDLLAKISLPLITQLTSTRPYIQMTCLNLVCGTMYITCWLYPPYLSDGFKNVVQDLRLFALCTTLCGALTIIIQHGGVDISWSARRKQEFCEMAAKGNATNAILKVDEDGSVLTVYPVYLLGLCAVLILAHLGYKLYSSRRPIRVARAKVSAGQVIEPQIRSVLPANGSSSRDIATGQSPRGPALLPMPQTP